jgi:hypothetical protein
MLHQLALEAGKKRLSAQTFFVHQGDLIPVVDNFLYALALMRTKVADRVMEARDLIERLLPFQSESGNFPIHLHEWPNCNDRLIGAQILIPMHWITTEFGAVIGGTLHEKLMKSQAKLKQFVSQTQAEKPASDLTNIKTMICTGDSSYQAILDKNDPWLFHVPKNLGEMLVAYQLIDPNLSRYLSHLSQVTHKHTHLFTGAPVNEYQDGEMPETTLFDLYVAALTGHIPPRVKKDHPIHLWAAAIQPIEAEWIPQGKDFDIYQGTAPDSKHKGQHHFRYTWGDLETPYTLVCQGGNISNWNFDNKANTFNFTFDLSGYDYENDRDVMFYLNYQPMQHFVSEKPATMFSLNDNVCIKTKDRTFDFKFEGEKGLVGHIMRGNRPAQIAVKGENRYASYDWTLFLRSVRRATPYQIDVSLTIA